MQTCLESETKVLQTRLEAETSKLQTRLEAVTSELEAEKSLRKAEVARAHAEGVSESNAKFLKFGYSEEYSKYQTQTQKVEEKK